MLFLTGLTMSVGHCVGMCGPLQLLFTTEQTRAGKRPPWPWIGYHLGRVVSYSALGAALGLAGAMALLPRNTLSMQAIVSLAAGGIMMLAVVGMASQRGWSGEIPGAAGPVMRVLRRFMGSRSRVAPVAMGVANGFLPCGPVLAAALTAVPTAHAGTGALLMAAYGLGTVPVLLGLGLAAGRLDARLRGRFHHVAIVLLFLVAAQLVLRGLAAFDVVPHLHVGSVVFW